MLYVLAFVFNEVVFVLLYLYPVLLDLECQVHVVAFRLIQLLLHLSMRFLQPSIIVFNALDFFS